MSGIEFRDWFLQTLIIWAVIFSVAGLLSLVAWGFSWLWRKAFRDPPWPTRVSVLPQHRNAFVVRLG